MSICPFCGMPVNNHDEKCLVVTTERVNAALVRLGASLIEAIQPVFTALQTLGETEEFQAFMKKYENTKEKNGE